MPAAHRRVAELIDSEVMQDGEKPGAGIALAPLIPAADGPLQAVLDQIVGRGRVSHQRPRLDLKQHILHDRLRAWPALVWLAAIASESGSPRRLSSRRRAR